MKKLFILHITLLLAMFALLAPLVQAQTESGYDPMAPITTSTVSFDEAVATYRSGQYQQAADQFSQLCFSQPETAIYQYYYAISLARLGQYTMARDAYETAIRLAPDSPIAQQSRKGISYLPEGENGLDSPPEPAQAATNNANASAGTDNSKMMQMMMMMSMMGGGKGGNNMMMMPMLQQMMGGKPAKPGDENYISPEMMSQMMQQNMYEDMSPLFESGKDK